MGYAVGGVCYSSAEHAAALACSTLVGVTSTGSLQCASVESVSGQVAQVSMLSWRDRASSGVSYSQALYLPACDAPAIAEGVAVGWAIGAVWLAVAGVMYLRKVLP